MILNALLPNTTPKYLSIERSMSGTPPKRKSENEMKNRNEIIKLELEHGRTGEDRKQWHNERELEPNKGRNLPQGPTNFNSH